MTQTPDLPARDFKLPRSQLPVRHHRAREPDKAPDYEALRQILEKETGRPVNLERARRIGAFLLRLTVVLDELE